MKKLALLLVVFIFPVSLCAQKNLLPAVKAAMGQKAVVTGSFAGQLAGSSAQAGALLGARGAVAQAAPGRLLTPRPKPISKPTGPLRYIAPGQINEEKLSRLSALITRRVHLLHPSKGTKRTLEELAEFIADEARPKVLRAQALGLLLTDWTPQEAKLFLSLYPFLTTDTAFSVENNRTLLKLVPVFKKQISGLSQNRERILGALQMNSFESMEQLVREIPPQSQFILLGEVHNRRGIVQQVAALLQAYRRQYPERKIVLFSEFLSNRYPALWRPGEIIPADFFAKNPEYTNEVYRITQPLGIDVYGLEDLRFTYLRMPAVSGLSFSVANTSLQAMVMRNKSWEKIIRTVMQKTRQKFPDAVFFVYAGNAHTDKSSMASLSFLMQDEKPFSISIRNGFQGGFLGFLLGKDPAVLAELPAPQVWTWKEGENFSGAVGFDAQLLLPFDENDAVNITE